MPFILMTGSEDTEGVIEALDAGADDFLPKPVRLDELVARVKAHLRTLELDATWVKLDMTLVRRIDGDTLRQALVAGLAHFGNRSGQRLIAEGVERQDEAECLLSLGVEYAQGYLFGAPERAKP